MISKRKIGICLLIIAVTTIGVIVEILSAYDSVDYFWGYFAMGVSILFACLAIGLYLLSVHFKDSKPRLSKFLWWLGIYTLISILGVIAYSACNAIGVIKL